MTDKLQEAIAAIKGGDNESAQQLLTLEVLENADSRSAWLWLAYALDDDKTKREAFDRGLSLFYKNLPEDRRCEPAFCPYCGVTLKKRPTRKMKCPDCKQVMVVRYGDPITEEEGEILAALFGDRGQVNSALTLLGQFGIDEEHFNGVRAQLSVGRKSKASIGDTRWSILNCLVQKYAGDHWQLSQIYFTMLVALEQEDRPIGDLLAYAERERLLSFKEKGCQLVKIIVGRANPVCDICRSLDDLVLPIDEAIKTLPYPMLCKQERQCRLLYLETSEAVESIMHSIEMSEIAPSGPRMSAET